MAFKELTYGKVWTSAEDFPTFQNDEEQVRADMQYHPDVIREYINGTLLPTLDGQTAAQLLGAVQDGAASTVQGVLDAHRESLVQLAADIQTLASGGVPTVAQSTAVTFAADGWADTGAGKMLRIPKSDHKRENANFGFNLYQLVEGSYRSGTWGTASTRVVYGDNGTVTLTADEAYSGKIVFFGL